MSFSVQILYNERREPVEIFAGDVVKAHHDACRMANQHYQTPTAKDADVVVVNGYPQNRQASGGLAWARRSLRSGGTAVLIAQHPDAMSTIHYLGERVQYTGRAYWETLESAPKPVEQAAQIIVFSQHMHKRDLDRISYPQVRLARSWDEVLQLLKKHHRAEARVAIYPYAPIQQPEVELT